MEHQAHNSYLEAQVLTATPQKLRLMLIEATISAARLAMTHWEANHNEKALASLAHSRSLLSELLAGIKPDDTELTKRVAGVYLFLFKTLAEAQLRRDPKLVEATIKILQVERDTWRMVCERMPAAPVPLNLVDGKQTEITTSNTSTPAVSDSSSSGGFVLEA